MTEHGIIVPYQTFFYWHRAEVSAISVDQFKWKKYLEISTIIYIPLLMLYYISLLHSFLPQSLSIYHSILISIVGTVSILCIIYIFDSLQKEEPEVYVTLLEFWIGFTILLIFLVVYFTKENIELKAGRQGFANFVTFNDKNEITDEFLNIYTEFSDINYKFNRNSGIFNQSKSKYNKNFDKEEVNKDKKYKNNEEVYKFSDKYNLFSDKDDSKNDRDDSNNDNDDSSSDNDDTSSDSEGANRDSNTDNSENNNESIESREKINKKKEIIKKIILKNTLLGFFTLIEHCYIAFLISRVLKSLINIKSLRESSIELQSLHTK